MQTEITRNEIIFYTAAAIVTFINMAVVEFGLAKFTLAPSLLFLWWLGYYAFPFPSKNSKPPLGTDNKSE